MTLSSHELPKSQGDGGGDRCYGIFSNGRLESPMKLAAVS